MRLIYPPPQNKCKNSLVITLLFRNFAVASYPRRIVGRLHHLGNSLTSGSAGGLGKWWDRSSSLNRLPPVLNLESIGVIVWSADQRTPLYRHSCFRFAIIDPQKVYYGSQYCTLTHRRPQCHPRQSATLSEAISLLSATKRHAILTKTYLWMVHRDDVQTLLIYPAQLNTNQPRSDARTHPAEYFYIANRNVDHMTIISFCRFLWFLTIGP